MPHNGGMEYQDLLRRLESIKRTGKWNDVAKLAGIPYDTVAKVARGFIKYPTVQTVEKIAKALEKLGIKAPPRQARRSSAGSRS